MAAVCNAGVLAAIAGLDFEHSRDSCETVGMPA
jgi:hypothetical protein